MQTKEYIITLHEGVNYDQFWAEMEGPTSGLTHVPDRPIGIYNDRNGLDRHCEYYLTDDEAEKLRNDPRVLAVEIPMELNPNVRIFTTTVQSGNFTKPIWTMTSYASSGTNINWGLVRHSSKNNVYGTGRTSPTDTYSYTLDGTGVDVIISDTGIQPNHPEFQFVGNSVSRVQQIDWYAVTGVPGLNGVNSYIDYAGHGTHVAGTAAGKTYGWAKGANIYSIKTVSSDRSGDVSASAVDTFQAVKLWHQAKTNGRPTVLNMSWAQRHFDPYGLINSIYNVNYRGVDWNLPTPLLNPYLPRLGIRTDAQSLDNEFHYQGESNGPNEALYDLVKAGVIVCRAAGNNGYKIDSVNGIDYNNKFYSSKYYGPFYYHRGFIPTSNNSINVGSIDVLSYSSGVDQRASYSCAGPGVDVFAAGTNIMSAGSNNDSSRRTADYFLNSSFKQYNDTGTSMASPQIAGICALYLQANPTATPAEIKTWLKTNANSSALYSTGLTDDYLSTNSQFGGNAGVVYQAIQGVLAQIKTADNTWKSVANVKVKTDDTTWSNVRAIWTKTISGWRQTY
jgi:subtilisin family serine protease